MDPSFPVFVAIGFVAQLIDGALGMAYGVASTTALVFVGVPPAVARSNVHAAEVFTSAASGVSHAAARNIDWRLFRRLAIAGACGGVLGAFAISFIDMDVARPLIAAYLFVMGLVVISKALKPAGPPKEIQKVRLLGFVGGFADASGGGGWGPIVVSNLLSRGAAPAIAVGTVNLAEFAVTLAASLAFLAALGPTFGKAALGLVIGGLIAAPIAAFAAKRAPRRTMTILVGVVICLLSLFNFVTALMR
ncbi:MAG: sulfite exporter TauE/SafE family protein [Oricola sp.]|nr:sulfite exporter TauE/SafE family protein [Oricola sp.]